MNIFFHKSYDFKGNFFKMKIDTIPWLLSEMSEFWAKLTGIQFNPHLYTPFFTPLLIAANERWWIISTSLHLSFCGMKIFWKWCRNFVLPSSQVRQIQQGIGGERWSLIQVCGITAPAHLNDSLNYISWDVGDTRQSDKAVWSPSFQMWVSFQSHIQHRFFFFSITICQL